MSNRLFIFSILLCLAFQLPAQRIIHGKVIDATDSLPLPSATVLLKGTSKGVATDLEGNFEIEVPEVGGVLVIRFLGYVTQEVIIDARSNYQTALEPDITVALPMTLICISYSDNIQIGPLAGLNHTPFGFRVKLQLVGIPTPFNNFGYINTRVRASFRHQFSAENSLTTLRLGRYDNFFLFDHWFDTEIAFGQRSIRLTNSTHDLTEFGLINSIQTKAGKIGLGAGMQKEQLETHERQSIALIAEWKKELFWGINAATQFKKWQKATQLSWSLSRYFYSLNLEVSFGGIHYGPYNELNIGLAYDFGF